MTVARFARPWTILTTLAILTSALVHVVATQTLTGAIVGRTVVDYGTKSVLRDATVYVKRVAPEPERVVQVATDGTFHLDGLAAGEYQLLALSPGRRAVVLERVRVDSGTADVGDVPFEPGVMQCECVHETSPPPILLRLTDTAGHRLLRAALTIDPRPDEFYADEIGPYSRCVCGRDPAKMGREVRLDLPAGRYTIRGFAAGHEPWSRSVVIPDSNTATTQAIDVQWQLAVDGPVVAAARATLRPGEVLVRLETSIGQILVAIDATRPGGESFLQLVDRHALDDTRMGTLAADYPTPLDFMDPSGRPFGFSVEGLPVVGPLGPLRVLRSAGSARELVGRGPGDEDLSAIRDRLNRANKRTLTVLAVSRVR